MTPIELLTEVKARFPILLHDDETALNSLLKQAIAKYQELAGFTEKVRFSEADLNENGAVNTPLLFASRLAATDRNGHFVACEVWADKLEFRLNENIVYPISVSYLQNVFSADMATFQLPIPSISLLSDYLELLIRIPNSERERRIATAGKIDTTDIATEADLSARKTEVESQMRLNRAIVPPISLSC